MVKVFLGKTLFNIDFIFNLCIRFFFSFQPPIQITLNNYYRLEFRTYENESWGLAFEIEQISSKLDAGGKMLNGINLKFKLIFIFIN